MLKILEGTNQEIKKALPTLAKAYKEKLRRTVCLNCPSSIQYMILSLKSHYNMTNFQLTKPSVIYRVKKGEKETISNDSMSDKKAILFLKGNPKRITLFSKFPSNWEALVAGKKETKKEKEKRLEIEAELQAAKEVKTDKKVEETVDEKTDAKAKETVEEEDLKENKTSDLSADQAAINEAKDVSAEAAADTSKAEIEVKIPSKKVLEKMKLTKLRAKWPKISANSKKTFIEKLLK